ncbi:hypothetical protein [Pantanalinema sp. GBBB05]|uniref:hypothetical protein n=1 Tax=Pantanalinema sp. GBBB05 TaxID=2604139 RepID=UPI001D2EAB42|nr:hypothetical protein [Pantanalinema sp. GBBB05]
MAIGFVVKTLASRLVRLNASNGKFGKELLTNADGSLTVKPRKILSLINLENKTNKGNLIDVVWDVGKKIVGFAIGVINVIRFSAQAIYSFLVQVGFVISTFDWNASDEALKGMIEGQNVALAGTVGGLVGKTVGWGVGIAIGVGISFVIPVIGGAALASAVTLAATKEALQELGASLKAVIRQAIQSAATWAFINGYINIRKMIKNVPLEKLEAIFGKDRAKFLKEQWGNKGGVNYSFAAQTERNIEAINNKYLKAFTEQAIEEGIESFIEAGFIIAAEIDNAYAQSKLQAKDALGTERSVVILPDKDIKNEALIFADIPQNLLKPAIQTTINQHRLIRNRDIGMVMGLPAEEYTRVKPQSLKLVVTLFSVKEPPFFNRKSDNFAWVTISIPDVKRSALDWEKIKAAVGGANGFMWGRYRAIAALDTQRKLIVNAASPTEAEHMIELLLPMTEGKLQTLNITEEKKAGVRLTRRKLQKQSTRVYPAYCTVMNWKELTDPNLGRANLQGNYRQAKGRINLWTEKEPLGTKEIIRELLKVGV